MASMLGINMGNHTIKVVELTKKGQTFVVQNLTIIPTRDAIVSGEVIQPEAIAANLKDALKRAGIQTKQVVFSVGGQTGVVVRVTELPKMKPKELAQAIHFEIERNLPFQSGAVIRDHVLLKEVEEVPEGGQLPILFAAARSDLVDAYLSAIQQAGLSPVAVEVEPMALTRAFFAAKSFSLPNDKNEGSVSIVVNIGLEGTEISFIQGTSLIFTRLIPIGGRHMTESIRDHLGMNMDEAERTKIESGTAWLEDEKPSLPAGELPSMPTPPTSTAPAETLPLQSEELTASKKPFEELELPSINFELPAEPSPEPPKLSFDIPFEPEEAPSKFLPSTPSSKESLTIKTPEPPIPTTKLSEEETYIQEPLPINKLVYEAINQHLLELASEIHRSVEFLVSQRQNIIPDSVYLVGGSALLSNLDKFLQEQLGVPVFKLNPFTHMDCSLIATRLGRDYIEQIAPVYAVAVGLALWSYL